MRFSNLYSSTASLAVCIAFVASTPVSAQDTASPQEVGNQGGLTDIIVTATRRETNVQDTPLAITAISGKGLQEAGIRNPRDLTGLAPNLTVDQGLSTGQTHASIRGVASTDFGVGSLSPIAIYIDDVYQAYQFGIGTQIFDLSRVEVLRGPQGTLFGKNTTGGALAYYGQGPTDKAEGYATGSIGGGDFMQYTAEGAINIPLGETLALRVSGRADRRDNYIDNLFDNTELGHYTNFSGRAQLRWKPNSDTTVNLKVFGITNRGDGPIYIGHYREGACDPSHALDFYNRCDSNGVPTAPDSVNSHNTYAEVPSQEYYDTYGATLKIDQALGEYTLTAITGLQKGKYGIRTNDDGTAGDYFHSQQSSRTRQASQELRLATPSASRVRAVFGLFGMVDKIVADQGSGSTTAPEGFDYYAGSLADMKTTTLAAFGSVTFDVTDKLSLIGGLRYSYEKKRIKYQAASIGGVDLTEDDLIFNTIFSRYPPDLSDPAAYEAGTVSDRWKRLTWDVNANYKITDDVMVYGKIATGFRSGGFPTFITQPGTFVGVEPEKVTAYEIGFKSELFNRILRFNGDVYYMTYKDMQVQTPNISGPGLVISNAGSATIKGAEIELELAPGGGLHLRGSLGYNDAKYDRYESAVGSLNGNRLPYAPRWTASVGGTYDIPVGEAYKVQLGTNWNYRSKIYFDPYMSDTAEDRAQLQGDAQVSFMEADGKWQVTAFVNNITNRLVRAFQFNIGYVSPTIYAPQRTFGLRASINF